MRLPKVLSVSRLVAVAAASALLGSVLAVAPPAGAVVVAQSMTYTTTADFDEGLKANVSSANDQLELTTGGTFPFIWIALSQRCTIAKIDTATGDILGEYRTMPQGLGCSESSRTTVGLDGSAWVGHRFVSLATHVGAIEANQCKDRNNNGTIETSTGYDDVLPWPGNTADVAAAADECVIHHVDTAGGDTRNVAVAPDGNIIIGTFSGGPFNVVDNATGAILSTSPSFGCGGYGGLVDANNVLWSANSSGSLLRWDMDEPIVANVNPVCIPTQGGYGLAIDPSGNIWTTSLSGGVVVKHDPTGAVIGTFPYNTPSGSAQGLAITPNGDVWISSSLFCSGAGCAISHLKNDGTFVGLVSNPQGGGSTGVAVDAAGKIWTANRSASTATRIDPNAGAVGADGVTPIGAVDLVVPFPATANGQASPYNYSDMTGSVALGTTAPQGSWTIVQDSGAAGTRWGAISWNATLPPGTSLDTSFEVRAADSEAGLGNEEFEQAGQCAPIQDDAVGRFIEVKLTLRANDAGDSPTVHDVTIKSDEAVAAEGCEGSASGPPPGFGGPLPTEEVLADQIARARDFTTACPPNQVPDRQFPDVVVTNLHRPAINCIAFWQITIGKSIQVIQTAALARAAQAAQEVIGYAPGQPLTRGQIASMMARLIRRTGGTLPANAPDAFPDDGASVHQANINALAAAGVVSGFPDGTFRADGAILRDQMATFVANAYRFRAGTALPVDGDFFSDDTGNPHEANINALAGQGIVEGVGERLYSPGSELRRDQMASFVARLLDLLIDNGFSVGPPGV